MKILTRPTVFVIIVFLLATSPAEAQRLASLARDDGAAPFKTRGGKLSTEEYNLRIAALQKRKAVLKKYLASVLPASEDYVATERSLAEIEAGLQDLLRGLVQKEFPAAYIPPPAAKPAPAVAAPPAVDAAVSADAPAAPAAQGSRIKVELIDKTDRGKKAEIRITLDPSVTGYKVEVKDSSQKPVGQVITRTSEKDLKRGQDRYREFIDLADGPNTVTVSSLDGSFSGEATIDGGRSASVDAVFDDAGGGGGGGGDEEEKDDDTLGGVVAYSLGGMVVSQQAQNFNQADPFFGFVAGYRSDVRGAGWKGWRWQLRFQGIFTADGRSAEETMEDGEGGQAETEDPFKFIASRKTFTVDAHAWIDLFARNSFSVGPYIAWGASTVMDRNELQGEAVTVDEDDDGATEEGEVTTTAVSDNDLKQYREYGMLINLKTHVGGPLYLQAILARGWYEALKDLDRDDDTRKRFVGKLRIFPEGLNRLGKRVVPMFGVDLNAGTGPDQVKFFTGFIVKLDKKSPSITGK